MDSLLANYASSDDDEEQDKDPKPSSSSISSIDLPPPKSKPSLFSTLPLPKTLAPSSSSSSSTSSSSTSSSLFSSLPPPNSHPPILPTEAKESKQKKPIFASLPPPKSQQPSNPKPNPNPKRVVQFTLPLNPSLLKVDDEDDEEEEQQRKPIKDSSSSAPSMGLSSMLPAPKNSLCLAPTSASRRSSFDPRVSSSSSSNKEESTNFGSKGESFEHEKGKIEEFGTSYPVEEGGTSGYENYVSYDGNGDANGVGYVSGYENYGGYDGSWAANRSADPSYDTGYVSAVGVDNGSFAGNWSDGNARAVVPEMDRIMGKRGRNEIPAEIVEVNQAELIKNRPREDQVKVTGIAFGPAYQAVSTSKGKPSKLHKRKHQIGSLFFDMKQKEMELAERRAKGFLTKAETQAKYGW